MPAGVHQKQTCREQCEAAATRHEQCLSGRASSLRSFVLEPDEQIRREPGQLPEHEQGDDVIAEDHAEHRAHERKQGDVESSRVRMMLEIFPGVDDDQRADAGDENREQRTETIEPKRQRQVQRRGPCACDAKRAVSAHDRERVREIARQRRRYSGEQQ